MSVIDSGVPTIRVFRRQYGDWAARIPDLPGCGATGATVEEAVANARDSARAYLAAAPDASGRITSWKRVDPASFQISEESDGAFFSEDGEALGSRDLVDLAGLFASWSDEIQRVSQQHADVNETRRGDEWSVREIRDHLAETQVRWLSRLDAITDGSFRVHDAIDAMVRERIATASSPSDRDVLGSRWTARRVVRRLLEHQIEHLGQIKDTLAALVGR